MACSNYSITLNGTQTGFAANTSLADNPAKFTLSLWIKLPASGYPASLIDKWDGSHGWLLETSGPVLNFVIVGTSNVFQSGGTTHVNDATWHNIVVTWDVTLGVTTLTLYVDGVLDHSSNTSNPIGSTSNAVGVALGDFTGNYQVDNIQIWTRVLTTPEISSLFAAGNPSTLNLISYWKIEEGSGVTLGDSSGNSNPITFNFAPVWTTDTPSELPNCGFSKKQSSMELVF